MNLMNLIQWYEYENTDLFQGCTVPAPIDMQNVKDNIMLRCGLLTPIYNNPDTFKQMTHMWFIANQYNFDHLCKIITADYSPIENVAEWDWNYTNKDGNYNDAHTGIDTTRYGQTIKNTGDDTQAESGSTTVTDTTATEHQVSAFNSAGYQSDSKDVNSGTVTTQHGKTTTTTHDTEETHNGSDEFEHGHNLKNDHHDDEEFNRYRHGNIGVTTNTQLQREELEWLDEFNPYTWIAAKFERDMMIQLY